MNQTSEADASQPVVADKTVVVPEPSKETKLAVVDNRPVEIQKFEFQQRSARLFAVSGLFADIKGQTIEQSLAQAYVKISLGDSMGFSPAESMTGIDIIQGRVAVGASLRAARMQRAGYSWDILQLDDKGCRLRIKFNNRPLMQEDVDGDTGVIHEVPAVISYTADDAARAGLLAKDNYKKNPRDMFFARAITRAQRWYAPGVLGADILSTEEAIDMEPPTEDTQDHSLARRSTKGLDEIKARQKAANGETNGKLDTAAISHAVEDGKALAKQQRKMQRFEVHGCQFKVYPSGEIDPQNQEASNWMASQNPQPASADRSQPMAPSDPSSASETRSGHNTEEPQGVPLTFE